jgi:hypothetical protein
MRTKTATLGITALICWISLSRLAENTVGDDNVLVYKSADISDADLLIRIYNSAFYDDFIRYGQCQAYGQSREEMEK